MKLLKKIRRIASQKNLHQPGTNNLTPLTFHSVHGENVRISQNGCQAERIQSYCKGICFSQRPVRFNERVCIRLLDMSSFWSGVLRFGFTTKDPSTFRNSLPKYACPNLTNCGHTFAKALPERYAHKNAVLSFHLTTNGNVHFNIDGVDKGVILANIKINGPFWAVIDLYGNTNKIQFVDPRHQLNNRPATMMAAHQNGHHQHEPERLYSSVSMMDLPNECYYEPSPQIYSGKCLQSLQFHRTRGCNVRLSSNKCVAERNSNYYSNGYVFTQRPLAIGERIIMQVLRTDEMFTGSLAFGLTTCNPNHLNMVELPEDSHHLLDRPEYWTVIKDVASSPMAGDEISFTILETGEVIMVKNRQRPITLMHVDVSQNLWGFFDLYGSTLKVRMLGSQMNHHQPQNHTHHHSHHYPQHTATMKSTNHHSQPNRPLNNLHSISMHNIMYKASNLEPLSVSQPQWSYNIYKTINSENKANATKKAAANATAVNYHHPIYQMIPAEPQPLSSPPSPPTHKNSLNGSTGGGSPSPQFGNECVVCYEEPINSVFYTCGHVCMCFKCSIKQWQTSGHCPICRARIVDVIRTYWS